MGGDGDKTPIGITLDPLVSVVMPALNEEAGMAQAVRGIRNILEESGIAHEIVVVDNNSTDRTANLAQDEGARVVREEKRGYGNACIRGLKEARGEIIILTEADNTFEPRDLRKLLIYLEEEDVDFVLGTRTALELVAPGAKMDRFLHYGNLFLAKLIQIQYWKRCRLTDVGCTLRGIKRRALHEFLDDLREGGSTFSPEMIIRSLKKGSRTVEIPIRYLQRTGHSKITSSMWKSTVVGLRMMRLILTQKFWR